MFFDLVGLPGSGKSYFSNRFKQYINNNRIKCHNVTESRRNTILNKVKYKILYYTVKNTRYFKSRKNELYEICNGVCSNLRYDYGDSGNVINEICFTAYLCEKYKKSKTIYLFDEGVLHQLISLILTLNRQDDTEFIEKIVSFYTGLKFNKTIYLNVDFEYGIKSIRKRNRHVCKFDELNDLEINKYYSDFVKVLDFFEKHLQWIFDRKMDYSNDFKSILAER